MTKLLRIIVTTIGVISLIASIGPNIFAEDNIVSEKQALIQTHGPDYYDPEIQAEIEKTNQIIDTYIKDKISSLENTKEVISNSLSVNLYQQVNSYYCGPASVQMTLKYLTGTLYSQTTLGNYMNTTSSDGTYVYKIRDCLNAYAGSGTYQYILTSSYSLDGSLIYSIDAGKPIICHVMTGVLPNYNWASNTGHYLVVKGYSMVILGGSVQYTCTYNDPHYNNAYYGTYVCNVSTMTTAINNNAGYYIRGT